MSTSPSRVVAVAAKRMSQPAGQPRMSLNSTWLGSLALALLAGCTSASQDAATDDGGGLADAMSQQLVDGGLQPAQDAAPTQRDADLDGAPASGIDSGGPAQGTDSGAALDGGTSGLPVKSCVVSLHGKSGGGFDAYQRDGYLMVGPTGNADGWGGKQWIYFPDAQLAQVQRIVAAAIADNACTRVVIHGFSNGAAAAAKLYCRGNTFGGVVTGYVIDDPVPDHGADRCAPSAGVKLRLYWTGGLTPADGWNCAEGDWTCEGGQTVGIDKYQANLSTTRVQSIHTQHAPYDSPPEYADWL